MLYCNRNDYSFHSGSTHENGRETALFLQATNPGLSIFRRGATYEVSYGLLWPKTGRLILEPTCQFFIFL